MKSEVVGFRKRWSDRPNFGMNHDEMVPPPNSALGLFDDGSDEESWNKVEGTEASMSQSINPAGELGAASNDFGAGTSVGKPSFVLPTSKSKPMKPQVSERTGLLVKRTTDELASHCIHRQIADMKQPWQRGPLTSVFNKRKSLFDSSVFSGRPTLVGLSDHVIAVDDDASIPKLIQPSTATAKRIQASKVVVCNDDFRRLALSRFKTMVTIDLEATRLGRSMISFAGTLCSESELAQLFTDVFSPKSSGTILKRSNALWKFSCWLQNRMLGSPFAQSEPVVYSYICHLRDNGAGATAPSQFLEAMRFADALLGFCNNDSKSLASPRVTGAAHAMYMTKRIRKPAETLHLDEVRELERICSEDDATYRRVIAGHLLFCFMAAARWHDTMYIVTLDMTEHAGLILLEAATERHKSSRSKELQMELLPFTALGRITSDQPWGTAWFDARSLEKGCSKVSFLQSWSESANDWSEHRMSTAEATYWLRELLEPTVGVERSQTLTVHGLKATILSWAAKSLLFTADEQLALGHHVSAQYRSSMIYSRDNQIGLCMKIKTMLDNIAGGNFNPDQPRVERLFHLTMNRAVEIHDDPDSDQDSESDASSVASTDGEHEIADNQSVAKRLRSGEVDWDKCCINIVSRIIHLKGENDDRLRCGRVKSSNFHEVAASDLSNPEATICVNCSAIHRSTCMQ